MRKGVGEKTSTVLKICQALWYVAEVVTKILYSLYQSMQSLQKACLDRP